MSEICDFIPCAPQDVGSDGTYAADLDRLFVSPLFRSRPFYDTTKDLIVAGVGPSGDYSAGASRSSAPPATPLDVASCTGSSEALPRDEAVQQDTPDYIRRGAAARHRIAPLELFSAAPSPAKAAAASLLGAAAPDSGAHEETVGCQSGHIEQVTSSVFADPNQSCW
jgi:hypothetical protein